MGDILSCFKYFICRDYCYYCYYCGCKRDIVNNDDDYTLLDKLINVDVSYIIDERYLINHGNYSAVYQVYCETMEKNVAIKKIEINALNNRQINKLTTEILILKRLKHPNINSYYKSYIKNDALHIVQELCVGGDLLEYINIKDNIFSEAEAKELIKYISRAVLYCHNKNIVHLDIKPENIMFLNKSRHVSELKLIDFGLSTYYSKFWNSNKLTARRGTAHYMSPEVINKSYTNKCDIWSIGVILYLLLFRCFPFPGENRDMFSNIITYNYTIKSKYNNTISNNAIELINQIFVPEKNRISLKSLLANKWFISEATT